LLGWEEGQKEITLNSLPSDRIDIQNLQKVELINGKAGKYLPLAFRQDKSGLIIDLPGKQREELAYVLKISFEGKIPPLNKYVDINTTPHYCIIPGNNMNNPILGVNLKLNGNKKNLVNQWKFEPEGKGWYIIRNREYPDKVLTFNFSGDTEQKLNVSDFTDHDNQVWKIEASFSTLYKISNKQSPNLMLAVNKGIKEVNKIEILSANGSPFGWHLMAVCEMKQEAFKSNVIPGVIETEDFDIGCIGDAYYDTDEINRGGKYRKDQPVDIDTCSAGTYVVGWTNAGEWLAYTLSVTESATYQVSFHLATIYDTAKLHIEIDGSTLTDSVSVPKTSGFQNWTIVEKVIELDAGQQVLKLHIDDGGFNIDKMIFEKTS
jgi:hypothetical protein